ncbi:MAG TPA: EAL domain-containing protein [Rhodanobacteraceae bacterium]|jgi:diguanylate cyclase (GGDEF)-like protein|nr:EAL domain-containing protein [Rhodanobacteraceae bacterium]
MADDRRPVLVVASSREDRRVLFDALDGLDPGEILSARDSVHAHALLRHGPRPALAILDFEHAPTQSWILCTQLAEVPVIGLFGAGFDASHDGARLAACTNIKAWLRVPVDGTEARLRIREARVGDATPAPPPRPRAQGSGSVDEPGPANTVATLRTVAGLLQPARDVAGLSGLLERAMEALAMDLMVVAERSAAGDALKPLARMDRLSAPGAPDPLQQAFVQQALGGEAVIRAGDPEAGGRRDPFARATGCARYAALPLLDARRSVLGVMVCASRRSDAMPADVLTPLLGIVAARFAAVLELRAEHERGRSRALLDGLTGLPNRMLFNDRLESTLKDARRTGEVFAVLFVDLDRFKDINDSLGHGVGDEVLATEATRMREAVRASDTVARYAGDEFTLILRHVDDRADIVRVAGNLLECMHAPLTLDNGSELQVTASIGVSVYPDDAADVEALVKHADMAMYSAKGRGRNNVQAFGNVPGAAHRQRTEMESRLRQAQANGELCVHYHPQIDVANREIVGVEALVRWRHPVLGILSPGFFLPLAEETGLIIPIGEWVLRRACADAAVWQRRASASLRLAVNLSALQWMQPNLVTVVEAACRDAKLEPRTLDLEVTESVLAQPPPELGGTLRALQRMGCRIVIDDAGVGHMSPDHPTAFPIDAVKIDRSFVHNIGSDPDDEAVVTAMLDAARARGLRVVAEGVETERQFEFLRARGCDGAQGYLFSQPLTASAFATLLAARRGRAAGTDGADPASIHAGEPGRGAATGELPLPPDRRRGATG